MSGLEVVGLLLGLTGPLEQAIKSVITLRNHIQSFRSNIDIVAALLKSLNTRKHELHNLRKRLLQHRFSLEEINFQMFSDRMSEITIIFNDVQKTLLRMEQCANQNLIHFLKATSWAEECGMMKQKIEETGNSLLQIGVFLDHNITMASVVHRVDSVIQSSSTSSAINTQGEPFEPYKQILEYRRAAIPDFESCDLRGNRLTVEGKVKHELLNNHKQENMIALHGPSGVGKTTIIHILTHDQDIRMHFVDGIYYMAFGADATIDSAIDQLCSIVRNSGGLHKAADISKHTDIDKAVHEVCEWFHEKRYLLLVDDIWEEHGLGLSLMSSLSKLVLRSQDAAMVFTTRDARVAATGKVFQIHRRDPQGKGSRNILMRYAQQDDNIRFTQKAEQAITKLLEICAGLPVAHSLVGQGAFQLSLASGVDMDTAWISYLVQEINILEETPLQYNSLSLIFKTALEVLEREKSASNKNALCYSYFEMHRALCVLEKQQWAPMDMLLLLWNIQRTADVKEVCYNFVRVGLAEWRHKQFEGHMEVEGIAIHDLLHNFATLEAKKNDELDIWHRRLVEGYSVRKELTINSAQTCRTWWVIDWQQNKTEDEYLLKNICRHMYWSNIKSTEVIVLVTRPQWIFVQLKENGILQYERDVSFALQQVEWLNNHNVTDSVRVGANANTERQGHKVTKEDIKLIRDAARLSVSYISKNPDEIWFQLYDRLLQPNISSPYLKNYLVDLEKDSPRPWIKPLSGCLSNVESRMTGLTFIETSVSSMLVLPNEVLVVCGCRNGELVLVNIRECQICRSWKAHDDAILDLAICREGEYMISGSKDKTARVWEVHTGKPIGQALTGHSDRVWSVAISQDQKSVYTASRDGSVRIWDLQSGQYIRNAFPRSGRMKPWIVVSDNGDRVVATGSKKVVIRKIESNQEATENRIKKLQRNARSRFSGIYSLRQPDSLRQDLSDNDTFHFKVRSEVVRSNVTEDGQKIVIGMQDGIIQTWDIKKRELIKEFSVPDNAKIRCLALSRDESRIACAYDDNTIEIRDAQNGQNCSHPLRGHTHFLSSIAFIDDDTSLVSSSADQTVRTWNIYSTSSNLSAPDKRFQSDVHCVACTPDGSQFITGHSDGRIRFWESKTGLLIAELPQLHQATVSDIAIPLSANLIVSVSHDRTVRITKTRTLQPLQILQGHKDQVWTVDVTPNGSHAVTASLDRTIRIWDLPKRIGTCIINHPDAPLRVYFSTDATTIISTSSTYVRMWKVNSKKCAKQVQISQGQLSRREALNLLSGFPQGRYEDETSLFCYKDKIYYGDRDDACVLGTLESKVKCWSVSEDGVLCAVIRPSTLAFLQLLL